MSMGIWIRRWALLAAWAGGVSVVSSTAYAHPRYPAADQVVFQPSDPNTIVVRTTFGLMLSRDGGQQWDFLCGALTDTKPTEDPAVVLADDGSLILGNFQGLYRSDPSMCVFAPPTDQFADEYMIDMDRSTTGGALAAVSSTGGRANALHLSGDQGVSWAQMGEAQPVLFETVVLGPNDPDRIYLSATVPPTPEAPGEALVLRSSDGGTEWETLPFEGDFEGATLDLLAVGAHNPDYLYARVSKDHEQLLLSRDGGATFETLLVVAGVIGGLDVSDDGNRLIVGGPDIGLLESSDGGESFEILNFDIDAGCLAFRGDDLWACDQRPDADFQVGRSSDGGTSFNPVLRFREARGPLGCEGGEVESACAEEWDDLLSDFDDAFGGVSAEKDALAGSVCTAAGRAGTLPASRGAFWLMLLVAAGLAFRRRRLGRLLGAAALVVTVAHCSPTADHGLDVDRRAQPLQKAAIELEVAGRLNPARGSSWGGIWGYAQGGREYALLSGQVGLSIIDITDPANPDEVQRIQMAGGQVHRDVATHGSFAYVGGQQGADLFVIDLSGLPGAAPIVGQFREYRNAAHTLHVGGGYAFLNDAGGTCHILDLATPEVPNRVARYQQGDCHDSHLAGDLFMVAQGGVGRFDLVDFSNPASPQRLGTTPREGIYAHSVAITDDGDTMYAFEEANNKDVLIYDIEDRTAPQKIGEFEMPGASPVHNGWIRGDLLFIAYYEEGLVVLDITDRANPEVAAQHDTFSPPNSGDFLGGWNVYLQLPSRLVLMSDTETGLWVYRVPGEVVPPPDPPPDPDEMPGDDGVVDMKPDPVAPDPDAVGPLVPRFVRGDVNADGAVDRADAVALLRSVVLGQSSVQCESAGDLDDDGDVDRKDYQLLRKHVRGQGGFQVPEPASCAVDPTPDALGCASPCIP